MRTGFPDGFLLTPHYRLSTAADRRYQVRLPVLPARSRFLAAAFRSLATTVRSPDHHSEFNVPGLLLRSPAEPPSDPFDLMLHHPSRFRRATGSFIAQTRCLTDCPTLPVSPRISAPRWGLSSPPDRSVQSDSVPGKLTFRRRPISLRSPRPELLRVSATDQRSRSATLP